jgi:ABC-2 type transport system ATP-binding protein
VEDVCTHLLILKNGVKMADGSVAAGRARFGHHADSSLEDVFFRATGEPEGAALP